MASGEPGTLLVADGVRGGFGREDAVRQVSLGIAAGERIAIVGPNGAGKSTLLALLAGVLAPRGGEVRLAGRSLALYPPRERARRIGYLPQRVQPAVRYTVRELTALGRYPHQEALSFEDPADRQAVDTALARLSLTALAGRQFDELSGGERQRVLIASVLAGEPAVALLDEPTAALDIGQAARVSSILVELGRLGLAVVVVTHDLNLAAQLATRMVLMDAGSVLVAGPPAEVLTGPWLSAAYGGGFVLTRHPTANRPAVLPELGKEGER